LLLFFFFQAEDGIRDFHVTGVQTCALPILVRHDEKYIFGLSHRCCLIAIYLVTTKPDALTTGAHCARNASTSLPVSCALAETGIRSFSCRFLRPPGSAVTDLMASPNMAALSLGIADDAKKVFQPAACKSMPACLNVGTSGSDASRAWPDVARTRMRLP